MTFKTIDSFSGAKQKSTYGFNEWLTCIFSSASSPPRISLRAFSSASFASSSVLATANEFGIEKGFFLSNDATKLAFYRMDESMVEEYPLVNTAVREAKETPIRYPMAGMKSHEVKVLVYDSKTDKTVELNTRKDNSLEEREAYLTNLTWNPEGTMLYIQKLNRKQNDLSLISYDVANGNQVKVLLRETNEKYVEPESPIFFLPNNSKQFIFLSERDGFNHAYLYNTDGTLISQLTSGNWMINSIEGFNKKATEVYFYSTQDSPLEQNLYAYNF